MNTPAILPVEDFLIGDPVEHPTRGVGKVIQLVAGHDSVVMVRFKTSARQVACYRKDLRRVER